MSELVERAVRMGLTFPSAKGPLRVEDLYKLPIKPSIVNGKEVRKPNTVYLADLIVTVGLELDKVSTNDRLAFLSSNIITNPEEDLRFNVLKHVYTTLEAEQAAKMSAEYAKRHNASILELIDSKKREEMMSMSREELEKLLK